MRSVLPAKKTQQKPMNIRRAQVDGDGLDSLENTADAPLEAPTATEATEALTAAPEAEAEASPKRSPFSEPVLHQEQEEPLVRSASAIETRQKLPCPEAEMGKTWENPVKIRIGMTLLSGDRSLKLFLACFHHIR